ncbi:polysaccharide deacetylase family protein [Actinomadura keratinilytica]|uniref:polysaccharide deacetylase family protein n=1 Tax=Actinomadura keratinilytica TaxID=547461 RepID=UPI00361B19B4
MGREQQVGQQPVRPRRSGEQQPQERQPAERQPEEQRRPADGPRTRMPWILMYHSVGRTDDDPHLITVSPAQFTRQMRWLKSRGLRGVSMRELRRAENGGRLRGLVGLTFDDGYADFAVRAVPTLLRFGFTATVFVVAERIGSYNTWDEGPCKPLMTADQICQVRAMGMEVASHGLRHVSLPDTDDDELCTELRRSRALLEEVIEEPVTGFAYPYGHVGPREIDAVRAAGYDYGCAIWSDTYDVHALARTYIGERDGGLRMRVKVVRHQLRWRTRI